MDEQSDQILTPDEGLIRHAIKSKTKKQKKIFDPVAQKWRAPAAAFEPYVYNPSRPGKPADTHLSVNIESSLVAADLPLHWNVPVSFYTARIQVEDCANNGLTVWRQPRPENPHHGGISGLVEMRDNNIQLYEKTIDALARASEVIDTP